MQAEIVRIENEILERLAGEITVNQDPEQRRKIIFGHFLQVYNSKKGKTILKKMKGIDLEEFFNQFLSYGLIDKFLQDPEVEDIIINALNPIFVHRSKVGLVKSDARFSNYDELNLFIKKLIVFSGRKSLKKINNIELKDIKGRINIVYSPYGPQVTITRAKEKPLSIIELINQKTLNYQLAAAFWVYVEGMAVKPANILISGGPGSGKTTILNALLSFVPHFERLVVIEDTLEINTDLEENCSHLESDDELSLEDLVKNSLRMRPDRIIVGEVRGREAKDMMTAMGIGKYCLGTIHASTARETIMRLVNEPMKVPEELISLIDVIIVMRRFQADGQMHRVVAEVNETGGMEMRKVLLTPRFSYDLSRQEFIDSQISGLFRDRLAEMKGVSPKEVIVELSLRAGLLEILAQKKVTKIEDVTNFCRGYARNAEEAIASLGYKKEDLI
ncbi:CpaF family protein [Candidatus Omnitrophota bacterium]